MLFALAGLFVVTSAAPASADDSQPYFPPQKIAEMRAMHRSSYAGCLEVKREIGWRSEESYFGCSWLHSHMRVNRKIGHATDGIIHGWR
jgi:hypothetical protein